MALTSKISVGIVGTLSSALDLVTSSAPLSYSKTHDLANGTGANQADKIFSDTRQLAASGTENLDLAGVLTDAFGATLTFTKVKALLVAAKSTNTNDVLVGGHASAAFVTPFADATDKIRVKPGGLFLLTAPDANGLAVTATTGDLLTIANSAGGTVVDYDIIIIGT